MTLESVKKLEQAFNSYQEVTGHYVGMFLPNIDGIEREIAEKYMELPVDADGVPVHIGDKMLIRGIKVGTVLAIGESGFTARIEGERQAVCNTRLHHHAKPDKLKELLEEFGGWYKHVAGGCDEPGVLDDFCQRIREMAKEGEL